MKTRRLLPVLVALALVLCFAAAACAQLTPRIVKPPSRVLAVANTPGLYEIQPVRFSAEDAAKIIGDSGVIARQEQSAAAMVPGGGPRQSDLVCGSGAGGPSAVGREGEGTRLRMGQAQ